MRNYAQAGDSPPQSATEVESRVTEFNRNSVKLQKQKIEIHKRKDIGRTGKEINCKGPFWAKGTGSSKSRQSQERKNIFISVELMPSLVHLDLTISLKCIIAQKALRSIVWKGWPEAGDRLKMPLLLSNLIELSLRGSIYFGQLWGVTSWKPCICGSSESVSVLLL